MLINVFVLIDAMVINIKASKMKKFVEVLFIGIVFVEVLFVGIAFVEVFFVAIVFVSSIISLYITTESPIPLAYLPFLHSHQQLSLFQF